jgi:Zn-dependent protease
MGEDIKLGRIAGFPLRLNWSVLVVLWLFTWSLAGSTLPVDAPGHTTATYWAAGLIGAVILLGSILTHELAHALVARRAGVEVKSLRDEVERAR